MTQANSGGAPIFPHFIVVGAMKAGTSTLCHQLAQHPDIVFARQRSNYFDLDRNWAKGPEWYARLFEHARGARLVGEHVPAYSYRPGKEVPVPARIVSLLPEVKILWILRNPIDRAYSHYWFNAFLGIEQRSFPRAIAENRDYGVEAHRDYQGRGVYVEQIELYLRYFRRDQMHILLLKDLKVDAIAAMKRVFEFLGADPEVVSLHPQVRRNKTFRPRSLRLQRLLSKALFHRNERLYYRLAHLVSHKEPGYPPMDAALREELARFYAPHNRALAELTGLDLSHWDASHGPAVPGPLPGQR